MKPISLRGLDFTKDEFIDANRNGRILLVNVHINGPKCNFKCPYCLVGEGTHLINHTSYESKSGEKIASVHDIKKWIYEAQSLGARTVIIDGLYEPLMNQQMAFEVMEYVNSLEMVPVLVTNAVLMNDEIAQRLFEINASVFTKLNVPMTERDDPRYQDFTKIQNSMAGISSYNVYEKLKKAIHLLMDEGFSKAEKNSKGLLTTRLAVETVIAPQNYDYVAELINQMRMLNIYIHAEIIKPQGRAGDEGKFWIEPVKIKKLFETVKEHDAKLGIESGEISPPLACGSCLRNMGSFSITLNGDVIPCPSIEVVLGNLHHTSFKEIIENNSDVRTLRNLADNIQGDCKKCELLKKLECYGGCRGYTYMVLRKKGYSHNDALTASDPYCWRVCKVLND